MTNAQIAKVCEDCRVKLQDVLQALVEYYGERSETWQESEKGEDYQGKIDALENILAELEELV